MTRKSNKTTNRLIFGSGNNKLARIIDHISLPSGWSCPGAAACKARAIETDSGRWVIEDGRNTSFRCFSASEEALYTGARNIRWRNWELLREARTAHNMTKLILSSIPTHKRTTLPTVAGREYSNVIRGHVGGDFFSQSYFDAWLSVCIQRPDILFYAYTKSLPFWVRRLNNLPDNFVLTASEGGKWDYLIAEHDLRFARVVFSEDEAQAAGLPLDHDDSHAMLQNGSFALLLHGVQPKHTDAAQAMRRLRANGNSGYGRKHKRHKTNRIALPLV